MAEPWLGLPDQRWLSLALTCNFCPAEYLHDSWLDALPHGELVRRLKRNPQAAPKLSEYLREALDLNGRYWEDFSRSSDRLALLDGEALERLSLYLGVTLRQEEFRHEIRSERLRYWRQAVGEDALAFARKRAPLLGVPPAFLFEPEGAQPHERFILIGARFCMEQLPDVLAKRMVFKLPAAWAEYFAPLPKKPGPENHRELPPILRKLIKIQLPEWHPLFA